MQNVSDFNYVCFMDVFFDKAKFGLFCSVSKIIISFLENTYEDLQLEDKPFKFFT